MQDTLDKLDDQGLSVGAELQRIGYAGSRAVLGHPVGGVFRGAYLSKARCWKTRAITLGVVMGCLGQKWFGPGPSPAWRRMRALRPCTCARTPLVGAAEVVSAVNRIAHQHQPHACGTVGCLNLHPGSP